MKPFNLEEAKAGAPICTRDGRKARIICYDRKDIDYPIIALIDSESDGECITTCNLNGKYIGGTSNTQYDLFMAEEEHYDVNNFKPFDKVLTRDTDVGIWRANIFSHLREDLNYKFSTTSCVYMQCIPYNEETVHLIGTADMPPKKYINW